MIPRPDQQVLSPVKGTKSSSWNSGRLSHSMNLTYVFLVFRFSGLSLVSRNAFSIQLLLHVWASD